MPETLDEQLTRAWLDSLYGQTNGYLNIVSTDNWKGRCFGGENRIDQALRYIQLLDKRSPAGIYARITTLAKVPDRRGSAADTGEFLGFWGDLDISGPGHKWHICPDEGVCPQAEVDAAEGRNHAVNRVPLIPDIDGCLQLMEMTGLPAPTEWVHSGGGMYPLHLLTDPYTITDSEDLARLKQASVTWQRVIGLTARKLGWYYGTGVNDLARVLRIPGTVNRKADTVPVTAEWRMDLSTSQPYELDYLIECAQKAAALLEEPRVAVATNWQPQPATRNMSGSAGTAFNASTTWRELLSADGCTIFEDHGPYIVWTRPGKDISEGPSGGTGYKGSDSLKVFSTNWSPLEGNENYTRYGYYAATRHGGDFKAAARELGRLGYGEPLSPDATWANERPQRVASYTGDGYTADGWPDVAGVQAAAQREAASRATEAGLLVEDAPSPQQLEAGVAVALNPPKAPAYQPTFTHTDSGFADRLQARYGADFKYIAMRERKGWLRWDGTVWVTDTRGTVARLVEELAQHEYAKADTIMNSEGKPDEKAQEKWRASVKGMLSNQKQLGTASVFGRRAGIAIEADELDTHREMVTVGNGVLNLDTITHGPHDRDLLATRKLGVDYDPAAKAPRWERFLEDLLPDPEVRAYLQRVLGYTLTGKADLKAIVILHGESNCGKGQLVNALTEIFGDMAASVTEQTLLVNKSTGAATPGLQKLRGARLVTGSETSQDARLDEALLKRLAGGGDRIDSRGLWQDEESWLPQFTMFIATNFPPKLNSDDGAIWRRVKPIHFTQVFGEDGRPDIPDMGRKIVAAEGPGILNWILEGLKDYRAQGLAQPEAVTAGVKSYQAESDPVARFLAESIAEDTLAADPEAEITNAVLYSRFREWCQGAEGISFPLNATRFGRRMSTLKYERTKSGGVRGWKGLRVTASTGVWLGSGNPMRT